MSTADESTPPGDDRSTLVGRFKEAWRETVGRYATDDGETKNLLGRLVEFGALSREEAQKVATETRARIEQNRKELDRRVEESIKRVTTRVHVPTSTELRELEGQVDALEDRLKKLEARRA